MGIPCCARGVLEADIWVERKGYVPGESILFCAHVDNKSGKKMLGSKVRLVEVQFTRQTFWKRYANSTVYSSPSLVLKGNATSFNVFSKKKFTRHFVKLTTGITSPSQSLLLLHRVYLFAISSTCLTKFRYTASSISISIQHTHSNCTIPWYFFSLSLVIRMAVKHNASPSIWTL